MVDYCRADCEHRPGVSGLRGRPAPVAAIAMPPDGPGPDAGAQSEPNHHSKARSLQGQHLPRYRLGGASHPRRGRGASDAEGNDAMAQAVEYQ